jgi:hypothetical protein
MKNLSDNWITEGWVDFEYKKYTLLAYLQHVESQFKAVKLYPPLSELIQHYTKLQSFSQTSEQLKAAFPKLLEGPDFKEMKLLYSALDTDDDMMKQLEEIVAYALPQLKKAIEEGRSIYDFLEEEMVIEPVGISPIYQKEGYAILSIKDCKDVYVYRYRVNLFQNSFDTFKGVMMQLVQKVKISLTQTFEQVKLDLIRAYKELPNPATYRIHCTQHIPLQESFLPISKRLLLKTIK